MDTCPKDETVGDSKMFVPLIEQAFGNAIGNVDVDSVSLLGDTQQKQNPRIVVADRSK